MSVTFSKSGNKNLLHHVGVSPIKAAALDVAGGKLALSGVTFKVIGGGFKVKGILPFSMGELMKMGKDSVPVKAAGNSLESAIAKFLSMVDPAGKLVGLDPVVQASKPLNPSAAFAELAKKAVVVSDAGMPDKLAAAGKMYQPVRGTSAGSVYAVVAMSESMKVAVRVGPEKLSVRVEGSCVGLPATSKKLVEMGFQQSKGSHYSMHMNCGNVPIERVIGAVLAGLGMEFTTPVPVLDRVKESCK
jgi:hypothetical protein